jgi:3-deoxy-D-manno-octulosonate 8-phosphate phosphatase (KDO 8-P phosphatase)
VIEVVLLDIDGVLTDGTVWVDGEGHEFKRIRFDDIDAIFEMKRAGLRIGFITGEDSSFCGYVRERFKPDFFVRGCKDKLEAYGIMGKEWGLDDATVCYVGDSAKDVGLLRYVADSYVPADASEVARSAARTVLGVKRGEGVVREVALLLLQQRSRST